MKAIASLKATPAIILAVVFVLSRIAYKLVFNTHLNPSPLNFYWQIIDPELLQNHLWTSLYYLHDQVPLFNLFLGGVLQLFPQHYTPVFEFLYMLMGYAICCSLYGLMRNIGVSARISLWLTIIYIIHPTTIRYENWLFYAYPITCLMCVSAWALSSFIIKKENRYLHMFTWTICGLFYLHTTYNIYWFLFISAGLFYAYKKQRKHIAKAFMLPTLLVLGLIIKHIIVFGSPTIGMSQLSGNLVKRLEVVFTEGEKKQMLESEHLPAYCWQGQFRVASDYDEFTEGQGKTGITVLDRVRKSSGARNLHHIWHQKMAEICVPFYKKLVLKNPWILIESQRLANYQNYFTPAGENYDIKAIFSSQPFSVFSHAVNLFLVGQFTDGGIGIYLIFVLPALVVYGAFLILSKRSSLQWGQKIVLWYLLFNILYLTALCLLPPSDQSRYRFAFNPFYLTIFGLVITKFSVQIRQFLFFLHKVRITYFVAAGALFIGLLCFVTPRIEAGESEDYRVNLTVNYNNWQNSDFILESREGCIKELWIASASGNRQVKFDPPICKKTKEDPNLKTKTIISLAEYLEKGENRLIFVFKNSNHLRGLYFNSAPFSGYQFSAIISMCIFILIAVAVMRLLEHLGFENITRWMVLIVMFYVLFWLQCRPNTYVTNDFWGHVGYIEHMGKNFWSPYSYGGGENWHPPFFYGIAALAEQVFTQSFLGPLAITRIISSICFFVFIIYGLRTLQISYAPRNLIYYIGCALIVFWPQDILFSTSITNDMAFSAVGAAVFYYLVHWYNSGSKTLPYTALALTGLAFMIKSNAVIYAAIVMICILHSLLSKRIKLVAFLKYEAIVSIFLLIAGGIFNVGKLIFYYLREMPLRQTHFGQTGTAMPGIKHFITLDYIDFIQNPFIKRPFVTEPAFWNMFLKSSLYGEFSYDNIILAQLLNGALLALVFITMVLAGLLIISGRNNKALLPHIVAIIISILMIMIFTSIKRHLAAQEFRFCMLMLIPLVVLYVRGLAEAKERYLVLYKLGAFIGIVFSLAGLIFYLFQPFDFGL